MKRILVAMALVLLLGTAAEPHDGMIVLFTDMDLTDRDDEIGLYDIQDIYLFYVRGNGPDQLGGYQFRFRVSSPDVLIMNPEWPPNVWATGNVTECLAAVGYGVNLCTEWGTGDYFYLGTIPVINYGDPDSFTISVVAPINQPDWLQICLCKSGFPTHQVIGDMFLFNGTYEPPHVVDAKARSQNSVEVFFDRMLSWASAHKLSNYYLYREIHPDCPATITGINVSLDCKSVIVTFEESLIWEQSYVIEAGGIKDVNGFTILHDAPGSELAFVASENTATLLLGYAVEKTQRSIDVTWELSEMDGGISFHVLRAENPALEYAELPDAGLAREGLTFTYEDREYEYGATYRYRVVYDDGTARRTLFETGDVTVPALQLALGQNYPNPFNPSTMISYYVPADGYVRLDVYDVSGRLVKRLTDEFCTKGEHTAEWRGFDDHGNTASSGVYFYSLVYGKQVLTRKMILMR